jgi:protein-S-isoprenylcysteine O-methyltransferase Ste14
MPRSPIPPPVWMVLAATLMWALNHWFPVAQLIHNPWRRLGWIPVILGVAIDVSSVLRFHRVGTTVNPLDPSKTSKLVTTGLYRISRNPMYLGLLVILSGWALLLGSASPFVVLPVFVVVIATSQIVPEEKMLAKLFGEEYLIYSRCVRRWLGRYGSSGGA